MSDRAISVAVVHGLTLAITAILISGLLLGAGNVLDAQEERVAKAQFDEIGGDVTAQVNSLDRLNQTGTAVNVTVRPEYPERVGGETWTMSLINGSNSDVYNTSSVVQIESPYRQRTIQYPVENTTAIEYGGPDNSDTPIISLCEGVIQFGECT